MRESLRMRDIDQKYIRTDEAIIDIDQIYAISSYN